MGHHYKNYLNTVGFSPDHLNEQDTEFIVLEVCHEGNGLKSFISFFNEYKKKPYVIYLQHRFFSPVYMPVNRERLLIDDAENKLTVALANADSFDDRLVPQFQFHKWATVKPLEFKPSENALILREQLTHFVQQDTIPE